MSGNNGRRLRILLADHRPIIRQGLAGVLEKEWDQAVFGEADNDQLVLNLTGSGPWDVVILGVFMPRKSGFDCLRELKSRCHSLSVLVLTALGDALSALEAFNHGASGCLAEAAAPEELVIAVKKLLSGGKHIPADVAGRLLTELGSRRRGTRGSLSGREIQVLSSVTSGKKLVEIARELSLSAKTVSTYRRRILDKLRAKTNAELIVYAVHNGLGPEYGARSTTPAVA